MSAAAQAAARLAPAGLRDMARQGAESLAAAVKIISDLTAQEASLVVGMVRERATLRPAASTVEAAGRVVTGFTDAGKILLDLAANESALLVDGLKEGLRLQPSLAALADLGPRGIGTLVDMHKALLETIAVQTHEVVASYADGEPLMAGTRMAKMAREGIASFIEVQKVFLDQVAEQVTIATEAGKETKTARRDRTKALTGLARDGVNKFIEAQKQIFDLAIEQVETGMGPAHPKGEPPRTSLAILARESVQNFTSAQRSLLDLALQQVAADEPKPRTAHPRPKPRKRARAGKTAKAAAVSG